MGKSKCSCCTPFVCLIAMVVIGVIFIGIGAGAIPLLNNLFEKLVKENLVLKKGTEAYNNWYNPPAPIYMQYYIFNYTNIEDILSSKAKPNVTQLGPYSYKEVRINYILDCNDYDITYMQNYSYVFDPTTSCSGCTENDTLNTPNTFTLTIINKFQELNFSNPLIEAVVMEAIDLFLDTSKGATLFYTNITVYQLLWGYSDPFLKVVKEIEDIVKVLKFNITLPEMPSVVKLQFNGTEQANEIGNITISTGKENIKDIQHIVKWRGLKNAPYWRTKYGDMINGTDGTHFQPFIEKDEKIYIFVTELCRAIYLEYDSPATLMGIDLYRYSTTPSLFQNHNVNPDNGAFCSVDKCWRSGIIPVGGCQDGNPPVFMSAPHFYSGDQSLIDAINGLHPEGKLHATFLDVEPITGIPMEAHKRIQINILVQQTKNLTITKPMREKEIFLPILFIHEVGKVDKRSADKFKKDVLTPKKVMKGGEYGLIAVGGLLLLISVVIGIRRRKMKYSKLENQTVD